MSVSTDEILNRYIYQLNHSDNQQIPIKEFFDKIVNTLIENKESINNLSNKLNSLAITTNSINNKSTNTIINNTNQIRKDLNKSYSTIIINNKNIIIRKSINILKTTGEGEIKELIVKSSSKIGIYILIDNKELYNFNSKFDDLILLSEYSDAISAVITPDNSYIICIKYIKFKNNIKIDIILDETINSTLDNVFCIYNLR